jgi:hypothetical protein
MPSNAKLTGARPLLARVERIVSSWVRYFIYSDKPNIFVATDGHGYEHIDQPNKTALFAELSMPHSIETEFISLV